MEPQIPGIGILKELQSVAELGSELIQTYPIFTGFLAVILVGILVFGLRLRADRSTADTATGPVEAQPRQPIGYKYADISRSGKFLGLARGKPYWIDSTTSEKSMGFHSYKSIKLLKENTVKDGYDLSGALLLEVLHYGEITEYEDGFVSTGQRVLQVAPSGGACFGGPFSGGYCSNEVEFIYIFGRKISLTLCRPHYAGVSPFLKLVPGIKNINIQRWLKELSKNPEARSVRVAETIRAMELSQ